MQAQTNNDIVHVQPQGQIMVYCCGGAGVNIGKQLQARPAPANENLYAKIQLAFVDTSRANLQGMVERDFFHIRSAESSIRQVDTELDGSGGRRQENAEHIAAAVDPILHQFAPADYNIVIHSTGGGSGSVIGPMITRRLLELGRNVIVLPTGSTATVNDLTNTIGTIRTYFNIQQTTGRALPIALRVTGAEVTEQTVNGMFIDLIISLALLFSRQNGRLDSKDLNHWINFERVTATAPRLVGLNMVDNRTAEGLSQNVVSVATLTAEHIGAAMGSRTPQYQAVGIMPRELATGVESMLPMHFVLSDTAIDEQFAQLLERHERLQAELQVKQRPAVNYLSGKETTDSTGMVF